MQNDSKNDSIEEFISNFPLNDTRIINTRFCKIAIDNLLNKIELNSNNTIMQYIEKIISRSSEELKPYLIANLFYYFQEPKIMGQENIAIDLAKKYFNNGAIKWPYTDSYLPKAFTYMNENSLIGMQAPELNLEDTLGRKVSLRSLDKEYTIIYFYSDDCITCKVETPKLIEFLNSYFGSQINVYAVYTGDNKNIWRNYIKKNLNIDNSYINWINVYDPTLDSNFPLLYGVVTTPKIYLINKEKYIIGRRLNTNSLRELLYIENYNKRK
jgi:AhpC/TSA family.